MGALLDLVKHCRCHIDFDNARDLHYAPEDRDADVVIYLGFTMTGKWPTRARLASRRTEDLWSNDAVILVRARLRQPIRRS